jgi:hypothetical protein
MIHVKKRQAAVQQPVATAGMERVGNRKIQANGKLQGGRWGMTNHHKALQRYVFGMVAFLSVSTLTASAYWQPMVS